jgi:hypothetical protein
MRTEPPRQQAQLSATIQYAENTPGVKIERGNLIPWEVLNEHERSAGNHRSDVFNDPNFVDVRLTRDGVTTYASAGHFQFVTTRELAMKLLPIAADKTLGGENELWDNRINDMGMLRLSLGESRVWHVGNILAGHEPEIAKAFGEQNALTPAAPAANGQQLGMFTRALRLCARRGRPRKMIEKAYLSLFEALK